MSNRNKYSDSQIKFVMNEKKKGKTYQEIADRFASKFGIKKTISAIEALFRRHKQDYNLEGLKTHVEIKSDVMKKNMTDDLKRMVEKNKYVPIQSEFVGSTKYEPKQIKKYFGSFDNLEDETKRISPKTFKNIIDATSFDDEDFKRLRRDVSKYKRFIITGAVTGCDPHEDALKAVDTFCKKKKAKHLILPCSDPAHTRSCKYDFSLDHRFDRESVVFKDIALNSNFFVSTIKLSAKQINPLTGLKSVAKDRGSFIFSSPKQCLEFIAKAKSEQSIPRAIMTSGVITKPNYNTDLYMSERTAYIANDEHTLGGYIVEIKNDEVFFFRPFQFEPDTGAFIDLDTKYYPSGKTEKVTADLVQLGDFHVGETDDQAEEMGRKIVKRMKPKYLTVEDFFSGSSINHHEESKTLTKAQRAAGQILGFYRLDDELKANASKLDTLCEWGDHEVIVKYGNHEDFLYRWLESGNYVEQPQNHYLGLCLAKAYLEGKHPLEHGIKDMKGLKHPKRVKFLHDDESFKVNGIENGVHGHMGAKGKRNPTIKSLYAIHGKVNTGHTHSAGIYKGVFRVGTNSKTNLPYAKGASDWTQTDLIQHSNGTRQLINNIFGEYWLED